MTSANPRNANGHRRRQLRARVLREETYCGICGEEVDKSILTPDRFSPEVDEIVPVSLGGDPLDRKNCRLTHRHCNRTKSNKMPGTGITYITTRQW